MIDLSQKSGLNVKVDGNNLIYDKAEFSPAQDWEKSFEDGQYAYKNPETDLNTLYFGARYMEKTNDEDIFVKNDFMLDLTILNPGFVGEEFVKTVGHYHGIIPGSKLAYPEVYEVVLGQIEYLLQSEPDKNGGVDVIWVKTEAGDKIVMPPNYGHVSINVGDEIAVATDLQKRDNPNDSDYSLFKEKKGGAYYRTKEGQAPNSNYKINSIKVVRSLEKPEWGLTKNKTLYQSFIENPEKFGWLKDPQCYDFSDVFEEIK